MAIHFHPDPGTVLICDFNGFKAPEMVKRRPVIVISPRFRQRAGLCTVVPLSLTKPRQVADYNCLLSFDPVMPKPYDSDRMWVKADMLCAVSFDRLFLPVLGKDGEGKRVYDVRRISDEELFRVRRCVLNGIGLGALTEGLDSL